MENVICKNCGKPTEYNFCSYCGQSTSVGKVNLHTIVHEFLHGIVHVDKGIVYTMKELTLRPGQAIRGYFEGKRAKLFKPFAYLFLLASVYVFLSHLLGQSFVDIRVESTGADEMAKQVSEKSQMLMKTIENYFGLISFCSIPFVSFLTMIFFRSVKYNYGEHLVLNSYVFGHQMLLSILFIPLSCIWGQKAILSWTSLLMIILFVYMLASVFDTYKLWKRILYALIIQGLFFFSIVVFALIYLVL